MWKSIVIVLIIIFVIAGGYFLLSGTPSETTNESLDKAPAFSLQDIDGNTVSLSDFEGKSVVINSWATWCPFCIKELPDFVKLQEEFGEELVVIAINRKESLQKSVEYTDSIGITNDLIYLLDPKDTFYKSIGGFSMPETIFVDVNGNIFLHKRGFMSLEEMITRSEELINSTK